MPEESIVLASKRTDQLPATAGAQPNYVLPMWNVDLQRTEKVRVDGISSSPSGNFEWVSTVNYGNLVARTRGGKWWQSQQADNLGHIPGSDPAWWVEINKGTSMAEWVAGVYSENKVIVFRTIPNTRFDNTFTVKSSSFMFELNPDVARPYVSADFDAELLAGDWIIFHSPEYTDLTLGTFVGNMIIDLKGLRVGNYFFTNPINENKIVEFTGGGPLPCSITIMFYASADYEFTFPDNPVLRTNRHPDAGGWISSHVWKADTREGVYIIRGYYINTNFYIESIVGPLTDPTP